MKKNVSRTLRPSGRYWIWYLLPALLIYIVFMAYPLIDSIRLSLYSGAGNNRFFVGFANYIKLFTDPATSKLYWNALLNTMVFFLIHMIVQNGLGIFFANALTKRGMRFTGFYRTVIFIPVTFAVLVVGYLWKLMLNPMWSGKVLSELGLGFLAQPWLGQESTALICVALVSCWQWVGIPTMLFMAGFQSVGDDLIEAAHISGASERQTFWHVKLPLIRPVIGMVTIMTFVNNFNAFDVVFAMETVDGTPAYATDLLGTLFFRTGIAGQKPIGIPDPGLGAAMATITFIILAIGTLPTLRATRTKED